MRRLIGALLLLAAGPALAQTASSPRVVDINRSAPPSTLCVLQTNGTCTLVAPTNPLPVTSAAATGQQTTANSQSVAPASDSPAFPVGGAYSDLSTTLTLGQRMVLPTDTKDAPYVLLKDPFGTNAATISPAYFGSAASVNTLALNVNAFNKLYTASGYIPAAGDATGQWVHGPASTPVQQGGTISASGGTVAITFVNTADTEIVNPSTGTIWGSWGTPAVNGANSYPIAPGGSYRPPNRVAGTFTLLSTAANQTYTVTRF